MLFRCIALAAILASVPVGAVIAQAPDSTVKHQKPHGSCQHGAPVPDAEQIQNVLKKQFDRPDAALNVEPVTVRGNYAVAGWTQSAKGGRALLVKEKGHWAITVCAGDGLTRSDVLQQAGLSRAAAETLARAVLASELPLSKDKKALFASFEGMVKVDPASGHGHPGAHGKP